MRGENYEHIKDFNIRYICTEIASFCVMMQIREDI